MDESSPFGSDVMVLPSSELGESLDGSSVDESSPLESAVVPSSELGESLDGSLVEVFPSESLTVADDSESDDSVEVSSGDDSKESADVLSIDDSVAAAVVSVDSEGSVEISGFEVAFVVGDVGVHNLMVVCALAGAGVV